MRLPRYFERKASVLRRAAREGRFIPTTAALTHMCVDLVGEGLLEADGIGYLCTEAGRMFVRQEMAEELEKASRRGKLESPGHK